MTPRLPTPRLLLQGPHPYRPLLRLHLLLLAQGPGQAQARRQEAAPGGRQQEQGAAHK